VQFSHFSVKEFLTSPRLADSSGDVSRYHISPEPAHTILARACIGVLLRLDDRVDEDSSRTRFPLAGYAAEHWVKHAQFENVSSRIRKGMENLFNPDRPHFAAWRMLHDIDTRPFPKSAFHLFGYLARDWSATPLYYAALCGFHDLAQHLIVNHPQHVNAPGGYHYITPLVAALAGNYFQIAELLHHHRADVEVRGFAQWTPLSCASRTGNPEIVEWLLNHGADANARSEGSWTALHLAASAGHPQVARILLEHKAEINSQSSQGRTPLHMASEWTHLDVAELLLGHGVDVNARDNAHLTPLHLASGKFGVLEYPSLEVVCLLLEHGADVEAKDDEGRTALDIASSGGYHDIAKLLSEHGTK
jgi:ankyrin repeat protein